MITFEDLCFRTGRTPEEVREIIKGDYIMELVVKKREPVWCEHTQIIEKLCDFSNTNKREINFCPYCGKERP